ncbi:p450-domain-containing protein [Aspergillus neoniger CBS 115656]|uniref:Benzoate 4-monooxygenase bphA n=1 Tax=Aspergillus neoniger (strain CBS 115656) TaxID=1448310 RepID=A0A318YRP4_ASPNB|nr:p450-domain-containing protein [Aspergillus neoniger CBS 115656]PYH37139.1 p450-domain-containing protein [Aspergillus neoniger CBS 115656]
MTDVYRPATGRCPPLRQVRGTRLDTIVEDAREAHYADSTKPVASSAKQTTPKAPQPPQPPQLKLKTSGLSSVSRLPRFFSPISAGSVSSCSDTEWQRQMQPFEDLYDATDDDSDISDECTSFASTRPTSLVTPTTRTSVFSPVSRSRYPSLTIPSSTMWPSLHGAAKSSPIPPTPPPKIPVSPAALSMLAHSVPAVHAPPSLDGSVSSDQVSNISAPATPDLQSLPDNDWTAQDVHVRHELEDSQDEDLEAEPDTQSIQIAIESANEDWRQVLGRFPRIPGGQSTASSIDLDAEPTLRHISLGGTPDPWSETSESNEEIADDATPASELSGYSFSRLSIPSPARHTWSIPCGNKPPTSATAEGFYKLPFCRTEGEVVEHVIEYPERTTEEQLTAVIPEEKTPKLFDQFDDQACSEDDAMDDALPPIGPDDQYERDEDYESELKQKAMSALNETNPVNMLDEEAYNEELSRKQSAVQQQSGSRDTFSRLRGNYEIARPERPAYKGPFSLAPRNSTMDSALAEKAQFSIVEKEQTVLSQIRQPITRKRTPRQLRILDLGGHASCEWAWQLAHEYPHEVNPGIKGPPNHRHLPVSQLWKLPFADNKFDKGCPSGETQDQYDLCLKECRRCLKPGEITRAGPQASARSAEFASGFLSRLQKNFADVKRAWMFLPMGTEPVKSEPPRETPDPRVKSLIEECEAVQGPVGSTADIASVTGVLGGWIWEQWLVKLQTELGMDQQDLLAGIGSVFFKTLTNQTVTIELKNDIRIRGTLKSVDQYLNIKLDDVDVLDLDKYPHLSSVKNMFIRGSVVRFFQKADGPPKATSRQSRITQFAKKAEKNNTTGDEGSSGVRGGNGAAGAGGLFLEDAKKVVNYTSGGDYVREKTPEDIWEEEEERFQENGGSVKKRRVEEGISLEEDIDNGSGEDKKKTESESGTESKSTQKPSRSVSGPFIDESDSESEDLEQFREYENGTEIEARVSDRKVNSADETQAPAVDVDTPPVREATSHDDDVYADFDDLEEDEFRGEEDFLDAFDDDEDFKGDIGLDDSGIPGEDFGCEAPVCPVCQAVLTGLSETDVSVHVNDCLDGKPTESLKHEPQAEPDPDPEPGPELKSSKGMSLADRAAIARPAQRDPYATGVAGTRSAFSKLMAGNAEDTAWNAAAANEVASRGKQAYQRTCPFYKIIPGFSLCVDAFRYGAVEGCNAYFLSHFHSDHYIGLTGSWRHGPIYCSRPTANLVCQQLKVDRKWLVPLEFEQKTEIPATGGAQVTLIEANHCPGSAIFLFEKSMGSGPSQRTHRVLHCGDFRASPLHVQHALLRPEITDPATGKARQQRIDACYLDTTYLSPKYAFPGQEDVIEACADLCVELDQDANDTNGRAFGRPVNGKSGMLSKFVTAVTGSRPSPTQGSRPPGRLLVVIGTYSIGKERICLGIARALKSKIYATPAKQRVCACLEDAELSSLLTDDPTEAQVHMQTLFEIRAETLADYLDSMKPHFTRVVGFRPTGWTYRPPAGRMLDNPPVSVVLNSAHWKTPFSAKDLVPQRGSTRESACFGVPYSEHSSFRELSMFCCALRIGRVIPTVNVGSRKSRERMKAWIERWEAEKRKNGLRIGACCLTGQVRSSTLIHSLCFRNSRLPEVTRSIIRKQPWPYLSPTKTTMLALLLSPYGAYLGLALLVLYYLLPYLQRSHLRDIPAPGLAAFTNFWVLLQTRRGHRFIVVDNAHKKYGKLVRLAPRHTSIADDGAIQAVYGHGNGFLKSDFYDAFVSIHRGLFNTRDRAEHTRKRKTVSHTFSMKSIGQFEQYIHGNIELFVKQWNRMADTQRNPKTGFASLDALNWFNYLAFDIIGDLAFGAPFGMLDKGKDFAEMRKTPDSPPSYVQAVEVLNRRGEVSATLGCYPALKPFAKYIPDSFFRDGIQAVEDLAGIAVARVNERLRPEVMANNTRVDLLARLMEGKDGNGEKLGRAELTAEALTQLIAGSDTTSNTSCAILYWCMRTPGVIEKLHKVLDEAIPQDVDVPTHSMVKDIPYLQWVIWETMRIHSTSAMGLPREIPAGNPPVTISGHTFYPGDIVSVPSYTIHRSTEIWGPDAEQFVPERWDPARLTPRQKAAFIPFSTGPRACVGRNVAEMELLVICGTVFRLFEFEMQQEGPMETREGFLRKPLGLQVGMKRRQPGSA